MWGRAGHGWMRWRRATSFRAATNSTATTADRDTGEETVPADRLGERLAAKVGQQPDRGRPDDPAERVPEQEPRPRHPGQARDPRDRLAEDRHEATKEDGPSSVAADQSLGSRKHMSGYGARPMGSARSARGPPRRPISQKPRLSPTIAAAAATAMTISIG